MQALDEGRHRVAQEQHATTRALATDRQTLEVRSHVLSLRETELESRLRDREQATRDVQARRISALEDQLSALAPREAPSKRKVTKTRKASARSKAAAGKRRQRGYELMS